MASLQAASANPVDISMNADINNLSPGSAVAQKVKVSKDHMDNPLASHMLSSVAMDWMIPMCIP